MKKANLLSIILFLIIAALLITGLRYNNASENEISCAIEGLKYDLGLRSLPPDCFIGTNLSYNSCDEDAYPNSNANNMSKQEVIERFLLPRVYNNLKENCLSSIGVQIPGNIREVDLKLLMMELITVKSLEIYCMSNHNFCANPGVRGHVLENDINNGINRFYLCDQNINNYDVIAATLVHEIAHIAISKLAGTDAGLPEPYPNNVGLSCG